MNKFTRLQPPPLCQALRSWPKDCAKNLSVVHKIQTRSRKLFKYSINLMAESFELKVWIVTGEKLKLRHIGTRCRNRIKVWSDMPEAAIQKIWSPAEIDTHMRFCRPFSHRIIQIIRIKVFFEKWFIGCDKKSVFF